MNKIREIVGNHFDVPMGNLSYVEYFKDANINGKITSRTLIELIVIILYFLEAQEKRNDFVDMQFKEIASILEKIMNGEKKINKNAEERVERQEDQNLALPPSERQVPEIPSEEKGSDIKENFCEECNDQFLNKKDYVGHMKRKHSLIIE